MMEFRFNIMLSAAIHAALIIAVSGVVAYRDTGFRVPEKIITVALLEDLVRSVPSPSPVGKKIYAYAKTRPETTKKEDMSLGPRKEEKPEQKKPSQPGVSTRKETRDGPATDNRGAGTDNAGVFLQSQGPANGGALRGGAVWSTTGVATARDGSMAAGDSGAPHPDVIGAIRAAIEQAKKYPPLARKRGIEGTTTTGFTINSRGYPENIRIVKSSGSDILDTAAEKTVQKASPLPVVKGEIEVPITFRIEKER